MESGVGLDNPCGSLPTQDENFRISKSMKILVHWLFMYLHRREKHRQDNSCSLLVIICDFWNKIQVLEGLENLLERRKRDFLLLLTTERV